MNPETEQEQVDQYVLLDIGGANELAVPMDAFLEFNAQMIVVSSNGYGDDKEYYVDDKPIGFKMLTGEKMRVMQVKAKMLEKEGSPG